MAHEQALPSPAPSSQMDGSHHPPKSRVIKANNKTYAAKWNAKVLYDLTVALRKDPEVDLTTFLSSEYSKRLRSIKSKRASSFPIRGALLLARR